MEKKITIASIAEKTGLSPATISRSLNHPELVQENTVQFIRKAMDELGYSPAVKERSRSQSVKPLIIVGVPEISNPFFNEMFSSLYDAARANSFDMLVCEARLENASATEEFRQLLIRMNASGLILMSPDPDSMISLSKTIPIVQCCIKWETSGIPSVSVDDYKSARTATEYLLSKGRKKCAMINGAKSMSFAQERERGFIDALRSENLEIREDWIINIPNVDYEAAYATTNRLLQADDKPDAFFASSDVFAAAVVRAAKNNSLEIPEDVTVIGFDNIDFSRMTTPAITTISQPKTAIGYSAFEMIMQLIRNPNSDVRSITLDTELIIRETA